MNSLHTIQSHYWAVREYLSPVLRESKFKEHGRITPEEFVAAGDFLAYKFPVWSWEKGDVSKAKDYLPADKQYLVTRGVPCLRRATSLAYTDADEDAERLLSFALDSSSKEDEWVQTHAGRPTESSALPQTLDDIPDLDGPSTDDMPSSSSLAHGMKNLTLGASSSGGAADGGKASNVPDLDDIPDMEDVGLEEAEDEATAAPAVTVQAADETKGNLLSVRTYDVMITYDKYYQTPRVWLLGYDENGSPLTPPQIFQDISADHALKTVTIEAFPHSASLSAASVHPCKHASVMKKVIERMNAGIEEQRRTPASSKESKRKWLLRRVTGDKKSSSPSSTPGGQDDASGMIGAGPDGALNEDTEPMRVDFYLVVFLKFIASIVPTIEVDSTTAF